jgi:hypothetical protein
MPDRRSIYFVLTCAHLKENFQSIIHPEIALRQVCLTLKFVIVEFSEKKIYLDGMSILSIILRLRVSISQSIP